LNLFSGSGLQYFSIAALGVYPYITASIIMQLMTPIIPRLTALSNEGPAGPNRINQYTHWLTGRWRGCRGTAGDPLLAPAEPERRHPARELWAVHRRDVPCRSVAILLSMTAGTMLLVWIGG
jgi:preprotein translocase subunit SecY